MPRVQEWGRWLWAEFTYPPHMRAFYVWVYCLTICGGVVTWTSPPRTIADEIGPVLANIWAVALLAGGILGLIFVLTPWWAMERAALFLAVGGLGVYGYVVFILHLNSEPGSSRLLQIVVILLAATLYAIRLVSVRHYSFQPRSSRGLIPHAAI